MNQIQKIILSSIVICSYSIAIIAKKPNDEPKHVTIVINSSTHKQFAKDFKPKVKAKNKELYAKIADQESRSYRNNFHDDYATINQIKEHQKHQKIYVRILTVDNRGNQKTLTTFAISSDAKIPVDVPAIQQSRMSGSEKTKFVNIEISPIANFEKAKEHDLLITHQHQFKKLSATDTIKISASKSAEKKYAPKID